MSRCPSPWAFLPASSVLLVAAMLGCTAAAPWRTQPPPRPSSPPVAAGIPAVTAFDTPGGLKVLVAPRDHAPLVSVFLVLRAGHGDDPADKAGLARIAAHVLADRAFAGAEDPRGLRDGLEVFVDADGVRIGAVVLPDDLEAMVASLVRALEAAPVDEAEVIRARRRRARTTPGVRPLPGEAAVVQAVLGEGDALSRPVAGTAASRARIGPEDVGAYLEAARSPGEAALVIAGPVPVETAIALVDGGHDDRDDSAEAAETPLVAAPAAVRAPSSGGPAAVRAPVDAHAPGPAVTPTDASGFATRPNRSGFRLSSLGPGAPAPVAALPVVRAGGDGRSRTVVAVGAPAPPADAADEAFLRMAEQALGGALRWHLREDARLAYRVGHRLHLHRDGGLLAASASVAPEAAGTATHAARRALDTALQWLTPDGGVAAIRRAAVHALLDELDTVDGLGVAVARLFQRDLPPDHHRQVARALETAPADEVADALRRLLDPAKARIIVIGG